MGGVSTLTGAEEEQPIAIRHHSAQGNRRRHPRGKCSGMGKLFSCTRFAGVATPPGLAAIPGPLPEVYRAGG